MKKSKIIIKFKISSEEGSLNVSDATTKVTLQTLVDTRNQFAANATTKVTLLEHVVEEVVEYQQEEM